MHPKTRAIIFYAFVLVFIIGGMYALTAAFGFAFDAAHLRIIKTGSLSLEFAPRDAELTLNGIPQKLDRRFLGRDVLVKRLLPGTYEIAIEAPGRYPWKKNVTVCAGEVTRASGVILWPHPADWTSLTTSAKEATTAGKPTSETIARNVAHFWITAEGVVTQDRAGELSWEGVPLRGAEMIAADPNSSFLVTREGDNRFLIDLRNPEAVLNLSQLFQSLKEQRLGLLGSAPLQWILFHPFTPTKLVLGTERALYTLDVRKVALEKLMEVTSTVAVAMNRNEAIVADRDGTLTIVSLMLGTVSREPAFAEATAGRPAFTPRAPAHPKLGEGGPLRIASNRGGSMLFALTREGTLRAYNRSTRATSTLGTGIADFALSSDGSRIAMYTEGGRLAVVLLKDSDENNGMKAGNRSDIPLPKHAALSRLVWLPNSSRYLLGTDDKGTLTAYEADARPPLGAAPLAEKVADFTVHDGTFYLLHVNGVLEKSSLLP